MESMNKEQIEEIWITVSNYLPERMKVDCAVDYVKTLVDMDVDPEVIKSSGEFDEKLDSNVNLISFNNNNKPNPYNFFKSSLGINLYEYDEI